MSWSKVQQPWQKPLKFWYHKILCELGFYIGGSTHFLYHRHLKKILRMGFNLYGEKKGCKPAMQTPVWKEFTFVNSEGNPIPSEPTIIYGKPSWLEELELRTEWGTEPVPRLPMPAFREIEIKLADTDDLQNLHISPAEEEGWKKLADYSDSTYRIIWKGLDEERFKNAYLNIPPQ